MSIDEFQTSQTEFTNVGNKETSGNGTVMRLCPVALRYNNDIDTMLETAKRQSLTTHKGEEAAECSMTLAYVISKAIHYNKVYEDQEGEAKTFFAQNFLDSIDFAPLLAKVQRESVKCLI